MKEWDARSARQYVPSFVTAYLYASLADKEDAFRWLEKAYQEQLVISGRVLGRVKGGLAVDVGIKAFMPAICPPKTSSSLAINPAMTSESAFCTASP